MTIAIIFAAGKGTRLQPLTNNVHKSLIKFNNLPLIEHTIHHLLQVRDLQQIIVITGYLAADFQYLTTKYRQLTLINNEHYEDYNSAYALKLVIPYLRQATGAFLISGDMFSSKNFFSHPFTSNYMAAIKRQTNDNKDDWSYVLNNNKEIIDITKNNNKTSLLAGEWTFLHTALIKKLVSDLENKSQLANLQRTMVGKYLINASISHHLPLKPYLIDFNNHWDIDNNNDLERTTNYFNKKR